jgi:hypothetical protein
MFLEPSSMETLVSKCAGRQAPVYSKFVFLVHSMSGMTDCGAVLPSSSGATDKKSATIAIRTQLPHLEEFYVKHPAPSSQPDPRTIEMIKYYQQARKEHDFQLIEVRSGAVVFTIRAVQR